MCLERSHRAWKKNWKRWKSEEESKLSRLQHYWNRSKYLKVSWRLEETCYHLNSNKRPSANASVKTLLEKKKKLGNTGRGHHKTWGDERKIKRIPQENQKTSRNQTTLQKSYQRDKYTGCPPRKIVGTILKVDQKGSLINGPKNKETYDNA